MDAIILAKRIDGNRLAKQILESTARGVKKLVESGWLQPALVSVSFGGENQEAIARYVRNQKKASEKCGIKFTELLVDHHVSREEMLKLVRRINTDPQTTGLIMQRPGMSYIRCFCSTDHRQKSKRCNVPQFHHISLFAKSKKQFIR